MALSVSCAGAATLSSAYFVIWLTRKNVHIGNGTTPFLGTTFSGFQCENLNIAEWSAGGLSHPSATKGVWNPATVYVIGDTVESASYRMLSSDGSLNIPIVYRSRTASNKGNSPENFDGNWSCMTQVDSAAIDKNFPVVPFAYALHPLPLKADLAASWWSGSLWHSLASLGSVPPPGDVVQLIDVYIRLNYLVGSSIVSTISRPLTYTLTTGSTGLIANPGINAQFQCWATAPLATYPTVKLTGFDLSAYVSGSQPGATVGAGYLSALSASGGTPPYAYSIIAGGLPPGVTLNGSTGIISGTPVASGIFNFTAQVQDNTGATATVSCAAPMQCGNAAPKGNAFY